ncbi:MAG: isochorismatase family protein [Myxococcaceae bacterium]|nr:isochorismatase family protein [Myxococcaceae bacterium]
MNSFRLDRQDAAVLIVDIQERLAGAMDSQKLERAVNRTLALIRGARTLGIPVVYTEQYPKGLGPTLDVLREAMGPDAPRFEKVAFSSVSPEVLAAFQHRKQILVAGMESHICVFQTIRDLQQKGFLAVLCRDAVLSRTEEDRLAGIDLARDFGALVTTVEGALFDLLGRAGTPEFKAISQAVK